MNSQDRESGPTKDPMTNKARALFDQASDQVDPATGNRLRLMRRDALAGTNRRATYRWLPLGAAAATLLAVGMTWWLPHRGAPTAPAVTAINTPDPDLSSDDDTEIYDWLGEAPVAVSDTAAGAR